MNDPTQDAKQARARAQARLAAVRRNTPMIERIGAGIESVLEENHFSIRIARTFGLEPPQK